MLAHLGGMDARRRAFARVAGWSARLGMGCWPDPNGCQVAPPAPPAPPPVTSFNPSDGSVNRAAGDRVALYCNMNATPPTIGVILIDNQGKGFKTLTVDYTKFPDPKPSSQTFELGPNGTVTVWVAADGKTLSVAWNGGPYGANGKGVFTKTITCPFKK